MGEYRATYKCRLCGEKFEAGITGEFMASLCTMALAESNSVESVIGTSDLHRYIPHNCKDGSYGLADFIGFIRKE